MKNYAISVTALSLKYDSAIALDNVSCFIPNGSLCAIVGPNGAGKTTFLQSILHINKPESGTISFWSKPFEEIRNKIAYVPQRKMVDWTFPITVKDVVNMGAYKVNKLLWLSSSQNSEKITNNAISKMDLSTLQDNHINNLSGGQQQRVFIARALAQQAELYVLDEPLTGLDNRSEKVIVDIFSELKKLNAKFFGKVRIITQSIFSRNV